MRTTFKTIACILTVAAAMTGTSVVPSFAQSTTMTTTPTVKKRHHVLHPGLNSASSRNVGPSSSAGGAGTDSPIGGAGNPSVPGAPAATTASGGGK